MVALARRFCQVAQQTAAAEEEGEATRAATLRPPSRPNGRQHITRGSVLQAAGVKSV